MTVNYIEREDVSALFPPLDPFMNKGNAGRVLCVCGTYSKNGSAMCGAAYFAAAAAYRCGAGIVEIFTPRKNYDTLASLVPEAVFTLYDTENACIDNIFSLLSERIAFADSVIIGCGLGKSELAKGLVSVTLKNANVPLVIDADALNIISENDELWQLLSDSQAAKTVVTPHPGEMSRLSKMSVSEILSDPEGIATAFAKKHGTICLIKGHRTVITDGQTVFINKSGNAGMATAGMGDVLSGMIGALLSRNTVAPWLSKEKKALNTVLYRTATAAYLHGLVGDCAADKSGQYSLISSDMIAEISKVIRKL